MGARQEGPRQPPFLMRSLTQLASEPTDPERTAAATDAGTTPPADDGGDAAGNGQDEPSQAGAGTGADAEAEDSESESESESEMMFPFTQEAAESDYGDDDDADDEEERDAPSPSLSYALCSVLCSTVLCCPALLCSQRCWPFVRPLFCSVRCCVLCYAGLCWSVLCLD